MDDRPAAGALWLLRQQLGPVCYDALLRDADWANGACLRLGLSKLLGASVVAMSLFMKQPQIRRIAKGRSATSVSLTSVLLSMLR